MAATPAPAEAASSLLVVEGIHRHYGALAAVSDVSFTLERGEVLGLLGPNGAGKSTTMQIITGNLAPNAGRVSVDGHDLLEDPRAAKAQIGYLPERPPLYRELTVHEYLASCAAINRIARPARRAARDLACERCGLHGVGGRLIGNLSRGYQQRVGLAQAIIHQPPLLVLDEPTIGLDPIQIREIRALIREFARDHGIILSSHILPEIQQVCDRVQIIHKGKLVLSDTISGLGERMRGRVLTVQLRADVAESQLAQIAGIESVTRLGDGGCRLVCTAAEEHTERIVAESVAQDWGLRALVPERASLEDVFMQLTASDPQ